MLALRCRDDLRRLQRLAAQKRRKDKSGDFTKGAGLDERQIASRSPPVHPARRHYRRRFPPGLPAGLGARAGLFQLI
jgi:hypothetical protein